MLIRRSKSLARRSKRRPPSWEAPTRRSSGERESSSTDPRKSTPISKRRLMPEVQYFPIDRLRAFVVQVFGRLGVPDADAEQAADILIAADRRGIDSHGVARLKAYCDLLSAGTVQPRATVRVVRETPSTAAVDGGNGLGLVVGPKANAIAIEKALAVGSAWVTARNSTHYGIAGYYAMKDRKSVV